MTHNHPNTTEPIDLVAGRCVPCEGGIPPLPEARIRFLLRQIDACWQLHDDPATGRRHCRIARNFHFQSFEQVMAFVNAVADVARQQGHHPEVEFGYSHCRVSFTTHAVGGLTDNDFICAAQVDALQKDSTAGG